MNKRLKYVMGGGIIFAIIAYLIEIIVLNTCGGGLGCLIIGSVYLIPGTILSDMLKVTSISLIKIGSIVFYFIIGGLIGLLVNKFKNK